MTTQFTAIVESGCLRPTVPVQLPEGAAVEVFIVAPDPKCPPGRASEILSRIAALTTEPVDPSTSARHDEVLYGREAHP